MNDVDDDLLIHELVHVRQFERWGPLFVPAYAIASIVARARGGRAYADNRFEIAARSTGGSSHDR